MATNVVDAEHDATAHEHPSEIQYIKIAIILAIVTIVEVAIYYVDALRPVLVPALVILSAGKFVMVVGYFMHLKFDDKKLAWIFSAALVVSLAVFIGVWLMHNFNAVDQFVGYLTAG